MSAPHQRVLPLEREPWEEIMPGIRYGRADELLSPAYWQLRCATADIDDIDFVNQHGSLAEEIGFCLLGGFGVTLEVATAFYEKLKHEGVFLPDAKHREADILKMLIEPAMVKGRPHRYRFPNQRARRIHKAMAAQSTMNFETSDAVKFRDQIQSLDGVGPKTASWIARNWLDTDMIAILDIHVLRAGWTIKLFERNCSLPKDYTALERQFLVFADELQVRASVLDAVMWFDMRNFGSRLARDLIMN